MNIAAKQKLFSGLVDKAIATSRQLISMLDTEFDTLTGNSPGQLQTIVEEKKQYLIQISNIMEEQNSLLSSMQLNRDAKGVAALYANLPQEHPWRKGWSKLQKLAKIMAEKNVRNGILVSQHTDNTRRALDILTGHRSEQPVYQYGGKTETTRHSKSLAYA